MAQPPFTMSKYLNELDLQRDARKYYQERAERLEAAALAVIEYNRQHANDQYGDAEKAEMWACVVTLREAIDA